MKHFKGVPDEKPKLNLFFNLYVSKTRERQKEIEVCLNHNNTVFDRVVIVEGRPTFSELFERSKAFPNDVNCFCNSDIYFDSETAHLLHAIKPNECYALTRYDLIEGEKVFFNRSDSQDCWVFRGAIGGIKNIDFPQGRWGCDNRLAHEIFAAGYDIKNPSLSIKTIHLHSVDDRNRVRTKDNTIPPPYYLLNPTEL